MHRGDDTAKHQPGSAPAVPDAAGAFGADPGHRLQRVHDVQARMGQLGAADHLAGDRAGRLFYVRALPQPSEQSSITRKVVRELRAKGRQRKTADSFHCRESVKVSFRLHRS